MDKRYINPADLYQIPGYTQIVGVMGGTTYYFSGIVAFDKDLNIVGHGNLEAQLVQVFENLEIGLEAIGASMRDVVKLTIYVVGFQPPYRDIVIRVRDQFMGDINPPANTLIGVQALARPDLLVEVEATVIVQ